MLMSSKASFSFSATNVFILHFNTHTNNTNVSYVFLLLHKHAQHLILIAAKINKLNFALFAVTI